MVRGQMNDLRSADGCEGARRARSSGVIGVDDETPSLTRSRQVKSLKELDKALLGLEEALEKHSEEPKLCNETGAALEKLEEALKLRRNSDASDDSSQKPKDELDEALEKLDGALELLRSRDRADSSSHKAELDDVLKLQRKTSVAPRATVGDIDTFDLDRLSIRDLRDVGHHRGLSAGGTKRDTKKRVCGDQKRNDQIQEYSMGLQDTTNNVTAFRDGLSPRRDSWLVNKDDVTHGRKRIRGGSPGTVHHGSYQGNADVAVKYIEVGYDHDCVEAFKREVSAMTQLWHPRVAKLLGGWYPYEGYLESQVTPNGQAWYQDSQPFVVMEYVDGWNLQEAMSSGLVEGAGQRLSILRDVADALRFMHTHQVIHKDLKPSNVLVERQDMRAKVTDFGLLNKGRGVVYMAPEFVGEGLVSTAMDVWSFGVIAWELFSRKRAYEEMAYEPPLDIMNMVADRSATLSMHDLRPDCPREMKDLIARCLKQKPNKRPDFLQIRRTLNRAVIMQALREGRSKVKTWMRAQNCRELAGTDQQLQIVAGKA